MKEEGRERQDWEAEREMGSSEGINRHAQTPHELDDVQTTTINRAQARPGSGLTLSQHRTDDSAGEGPRNGKESRKRKWRRPAGKWRLRLRNDAISSQAQLMEQRAGPTIGGVH